MQTPTQLVMSSIASFNSVFLGALARTARERPEQFPLPSELLDRFRQMKVAECRQQGTLSLCLGEAHFSQVEIWKRAEEGISEGEPPQLQECWISPDERVVLAHSLFLVAWHCAHALPSFTHTLFGMDAQVNQLLVQRTGFAKLFRLAEARVSWIYPRWRERLEIWRGIIDLPSGDRSGVPSPTLRLVQACASKSLPMVVETFLGGFEGGVVARSAPVRASSTLKPTNAAAKRKGQ